jgi:hypothetical protein
MHPICLVIAEEDRRELAKLDEDSDIEEDLTTLTEQELEERNEVKKK